MADVMMGEEGSLAIMAPKTNIDALPYVDTQYNDPAIKQQAPEPLPHVTSPPTPPHQNPARFVAVLGVGD